MRRAVDRGHKLNYYWIGSGRVIGEASPLEYDEEDFLTGAVNRVHSRRLSLYRADMEGNPVDPRQIAIAEHTTTTYQVAVAIRAIRETDGATHLQVEWDGLFGVEDLT